MPELKGACVASCIDIAHNPIRQHLGYFVPGERPDIIIETLRRYYGHNPKYEDVPFGWANKGRDIFLDLYERAPRDGYFSYSPDFVKAIERGQFTPGGVMLLRPTPSDGSEDPTFWQERCFLYEKSRIVKNVAKELKIPQRHPVDALAGRLVAASNVHEAKVVFEEWNLRFHMYGVQQDTVISLWKTIQEDRLSWRDVQRALMEGRQFHPPLAATLQHFCHDPCTSESQANSSHHFSRLSVRAQLNRRGVSYLRDLNIRSLGDNCAILDICRDEPLAETYTSRGLLNRDTKAKLIIHDGFDHLATLSVLESEGLLQRHRTFLKRFGNGVENNPFLVAGEMIALIGYGWRSLEAKPIPQNYPVLSSKELLEIASQCQHPRSIQGDEICRVLSIGGDEDPFMRRYLHMMEELFDEFGEIRLRWGMLQDPDCQRFGALVPTDPSYLAFAYDALICLDRHRENMYETLFQLYRHAEGWLRACTTKIQNGEAHTDLVIGNKIWANPDRDAGLSPPQENFLRNYFQHDTRRWGSICD